MRVSTGTAFAEVLLADGPAADIPAGKLMTYGRLVGDWRAEVEDVLQGKKRTTTGEVHIDWILEGRAVQDVWIVPARGDRTPESLEKSINWYGTTIRVYNPKTDQWRITWFNPESGDEIRLSVQVTENEIIQEGKLDNGVPVRWIFSGITPKTARWRCEMSQDHGTSWQSVIEVRLTRMQGSR